MSEHIDTVTSIMDLLDNPRYRYLVIGGSIILSLSFAVLAGWLVFYPQNIKN